MEFRTMLNETFIETPGIICIRGTKEVRKLTDSAGKKRQ